MPIKKLKNGSYKVDISVGVDPVTGRRRKKQEWQKQKKRQKNCILRSSINTILAYNQVKET